MGGKLGEAGGLLYWVCCVCGSIGRVGTVMVMCVFVVVMAMVYDGGWYVLLSRALLML